MKSTYGALAMDVPMLRGRLGQPEFSMRWTRKLVREPATRFRRSNVSSGEPSSIAMTSN